MYYPRPLPRQQSARAEGNPVVAAFKAVSERLTILSQFRQIRQAIRRANGRKGAAVRLGKRFAQHFVTNRKESPC